ncbi:MAG: hypothetical protein PWP46_213 [Fusobacteriaceae bacterium]|jgi:uncharacterized membrane protein|nr:hypothetical protein [Fusobacteriaceae bacterium]
MNKLLKNKELIFVVIITMAIIGLFFIPTGFENKENSLIVKGKILSVDNSDVIQHGIIKTGIQDVDIKILNKSYKNKVVKGKNQLVGKLEFDKFLKPNDIILVGIDYNENQKITGVNVIDYYRINYELILAFIICLFLISFAGITGVKALISFVFTILSIWKLLIPLLLKGYNPLLVTFIIVLAITSAIILLVCGINKKALSAIFGSFLGEIFTIILSLYFGKLFHLNGATKPFSETLLYFGFSYLNLKNIFLSGIVLSASGAMMDISVDIAVSLDEIKKQNPTISIKEFLNSGFTIGRNVIGTMTTTLLLAYSGSYTTLLMIFMAQSTKAINIFNLSYVSSEILTTLVGSFGLLLVAPFTAITSTLLYFSKEIFIKNTIKKLRLLKN